MTKVANPTPPEFFERTHGRGVFLVRAFMDEVSISDRGNGLSLVKRRRMRTPEGALRTRRTTDRLPSRVRELFELPEFDRSIEARRRQQRSVRRERDAVD